MPNKPPDVAVRFVPGFKRDLKALSKKYRHILSDLSSVLDQLQTGHLPGDKIAGAGFTVYKVRVKNSDIKRGKFGL